MVIQKLSFLILSSLLVLNHTCFSSQHDETSAQQELTEILEKKNKEFNYLASWIDSYTGRSALWALYGNGKADELLTSLNECKTQSPCKPFIEKTFKALNLNQKQLIKAMARVQPLLALDEQETAAREKIKAMAAAITTISSSQSLVEQPILLSLSSEEKQNNPTLAEQLQRQYLIIQLNAAQRENARLRQELTQEWQALANLQSTPKQQSTWSLTNWF